MMVDFNAIYVLWLREMKRFVRAKSRVVGVLIMPMFFLLGLGLGLGSLIHLSSGTSYLEFIAPGIIGMSLMSTAVSSGFSVLWDRQFGFLKEIMVTPNSRTAIVLGRAAGGATTALVSAAVVTVISLLIGYHITVSATALLAVVFMVLIALTFISIGLILASVISDLQGYGLITSFITLPLLFLSNSIFPISTLPTAVQYVAYVNPLTYGIDGIRGAFGGTPLFPLTTDLAVMLVLVIIVVSAAAYAFSKSATG